MNQPEDANFARDENSYNPKGGRPRKFRGAYTPEQVIKELSEIAGDRKNPAQRVRALELLAKIHGMMSDKVTVTVDRNILADNLDQALHALRQITERPTVITVDPDPPTLDETLLPEIVQFREQQAQDDPGQAGEEGEGIE